jgi:hypothetical protein
VLRPETDLILTRSKGSIEVIKQLRDIQAPCKIHAPITPSEGVKKRLTMPSLFSLFSHLNKTKTAEVYLKGSSSQARTTEICMGWIGLTSIQYTVICLKILELLFYF